MAVNVGDIFVALGFKVDDKDLKTFDSGVRNLTGNMLATVGAATAAIYGLEKFISSSTEAGAKIANVAEQTGIGTDELQKIAYAANAANSSLSFDQALAGVANLRKALYDISIGKGNNSAWQILGVDPNGKNPTELLGDLAQATHGLDRARASDLLNQIGLGQDYLRLLENIYNNPNFVEQTGGPLAISENDIATLAEGDRILNDIWKKIQLIKAEVTVGIFNGFDKFIGKPNEDTNKKYGENPDYGTDTWYYRTIKNGLIDFYKNGQNDDPNANLSFSDSIVGRTLTSIITGLDDLNKKYGDNAQNTGDTNVQITVNGADDPQQTATVIQEYIQAAQDQRARSMR